MAKFFLLLVRKLQSSLKINGLLTVGYALLKDYQKWKEVQKVAILCHLTLHYTNDGSFFPVLRAMITMLFMPNQIPSKFKRVCIKVGSASLVIIKVALTISEIYV